MSKLTLFPAKSTEQNVIINVPAGESIYWGSRCQQLLPGQIALIIVPQEEQALHYFGYVAQPDNAAAWLDIVVRHAGITP